MTFRRGQRVTVNWGNGKKQKGRVICTNRRNKYGLCLIVLVESDDGTNEFPESFLEDGRRWRQGDGCHLTPGWDE